MAARTPRRTPVWIKLSLSVATFVVASLGLEALLRAGGYSGKRDGFRFESAVGGFLDGNGIFIEHEERFYTLGSHYRPTPEHLGVYATGEWNFRGAPAEPKPAALPRIAIVGDSNVYGVGVNVADSLPAQVQLSLDLELGLDPTQVQVAGFGVPSYSTVQLRHLLEHEVLSRGTPFAIVLYLAAWNDHAPAYGKNDVELRSQRNSNVLWRNFRRSATCEWLESWINTARPAKTYTREAILKRWAAGEAPFGRRVPELALPAEVDAILELATNACEHVVLVLGAHKERTQRDFPGLARDRAVVRQAGLRRGLSIVDGPALFAAAPPPFDTYLCDAVHPSPRGTRVLARGITDALREACRSHTWSSFTPPWSVERVDPAQVSAMGSERIRVDLKNWRAGTPAPWINFGWSPLLDVQEVAPGSFEGSCLANAPGLHDLIVSSADGVAHQSNAIEFEAPQISIERKGLTPDAPWVLHFRSRPGDHLKLHVGRKRLEVPVTQYPGSEDELDPEGAIELPWTWTADESGELRVEAPASAMMTIPGKYWLRGLVMPRGALENSTTWRHTAPVPFEVKQL